MDPVLITTLATSIGSTIAGGIALYVKNQREKREREAQDVEFEHLKSKVQALEEKCARAGDFENVKNTIENLKDTIEKFQKESKADRNEVRAELHTAVQEKREDILRIHDKMEKLYEKVLEWIAHK